MLMTTCNFCFAHISSNLPGCLLCIPRLKSKGGLPTLRHTSSRSDFYCTLHRKYLQPLYSTQTIICLATIMTDMIHFMIMYSTTTKQQKAYLQLLFLSQLIPHQPSPQSMAPAKSRCSRFRAVLTETSC